MAEGQYNAYCNEYGYPPSDPTRLINYAKKRGTKIKFSDAKKVIAASKGQNKPDSMMTSSHKKSQPKQFRKREPTKTTDEPENDPVPIQRFPEVQTRRSAVSMPDQAISPRRGAVVSELDQNHFTMIDADPVNSPSLKRDVRFAPDVPLQSLPSSPEFASLQRFYRSVTIDTDSDWESDEEKEILEKEKQKQSDSAPILPHDITISPATPALDGTSPDVAYGTHRPSVAHFKIQTVTVFGEALFDGIDAFSKAIGIGIAPIDEAKATDDSWKVKRKLIEKELIETEKNYVSDLKVLCNEILEQIFAKKMLDEKYRSQVMSNLPMIANFHEYFLKELIAGDVVQVFLKSCDLLKMYTKFVKEYDLILDIFAVHGNKSKNKKLYKFLKQKRKEKKPLTNLLISPIQRIPRYLLLLQDIKKRTPVDYEDYDDIETALNKVKDITNHINERQKEIENMSQCLQIQNKLRGFKGKLVEPHRKYMNQFTFHMQKGKKLKLAHFCVFSDTVIITDVKWQVIQTITMRSMHIKKMNHNLHGKGFEIKNIGMYFDTQETRDDDVDALYEIVETEKEVLIENDMMLLEAESERVERELGRIKVEDQNQKTNMLMKLKTNRSDTMPATPVDKKKALPGSPQNIWGRNLRLEDNTQIMTVEWKFVDEYDEAHCVLLQHKQIKGNPNKKSKRIVIIDKMEAVAEKSKQNQFKINLQEIDSSRLSGKKLILEFDIKYDPKKSKYTYPLLINGKTYGQTFRKWKAAGN